MKHATRGTARATPSPEPPPRRTHDECLLALVALLSLVAALLGAVYHDRAVWSTGLALFALVCLQCVAVACVDYQSKDSRPETLAPV
jgi:hypothetical protein